MVTRSMPARRAASVALPPVAFRICAKHFVGLEVAVHDALSVRLAEGVHLREEQGAHLREGARAAAGEALGERLALVELLHEEHLSLGVAAEVEHRDRVGVPHPRRGPRVEHIASRPSRGDLRSPRPSQTGAAGPAEKTTAP